MSRKINIELLDSGKVLVEFIGNSHFTKRELLRVIKSINAESKHRVKAYRREQRTLQLKDQENARSERERQEQRADKLSNGTVKDTIKSGAGQSGGLAAAIAAKQERRSEEGPRES
jgi:hypothetical protein